MALNHITFYSKLMEMEMGIDVIIPENKWGYSLAERPKDYKYPVLWLLCGGGFDYTDWQRYTAIELYAAQAGIAVVCQVPIIPDIWILSMEITNIFL